MFPPCLVGSRPRLAQQRPGLSPRRHGSSATDQVPPFVHAQQRPGLSPRRHLSRPPSPCRPSPRTLNKGRGSHPGDTHQACETTPSTFPIAQQRPGLSPRRHDLPHIPLAMRNNPAQQRPGLSPRRHLRRQARPGAAGVHARSTKAGALTPATRLWRSRRRLSGRRRSTKAGALTPATPPHKVGIPEAMTAQQRPGLSPRRHTARLLGGLPGRALAQQRPGLSPRRHLLLDPGTLRGPARSTKAGALTPATRGGRRRTPPRPRSTLNKGRGSHPGDTSRPVWEIVKYLGCLALNKGRGSHPGDTGRTRPRGRPAGPPLNKGRGSHPGDTRTGPAFRASNHHRSTKAGALTPATHRRPRGAHTPRHSTLNKGRGSHPGDTTGGTPMERVGAALNKGRGSHPGDTTSASVTSPTALPAQQRPGLSPRRHLAMAAALNGRNKRSTKAGALTPATPGP